MDVRFVVAALMVFLAACGSASEGGTGGGGAGAAAGSGGAEPALEGWPLAVPRPAFGVDDEAPAPPDPWTTPMAGFYWVDNSQPNATDDANPYGTPALPRATIPGALPAGAVVYVAGGNYAGDTLGLAAAGTAAAPVFVTGVDAAHPPVVAAPVELSGSYLIVERLDFSGPASSVAVLTPSDHVALRHSEVHGGAGGPSAGIYTGRWNPEDDPAMADQIVFYDNRVHDNGDWHATFDEDHHGIALGHHASNVWIVGNVLYHNSGDGLQINAKKASLMGTLHHVYVGRNVAYENKQSGLWTKQATDVVFSQNVVHDHWPSGSSGGAGIGFQYGPERVWIVFNLVYACELGLTSSTNVGDEDGVAGPGQDVYVVGNLFAGIHKADGSGPTTDPWQGGSAIHFTDELAAKHVHFNTVVDADVGLTYARGTGPLDAVDNLLASVAGSHVHLETPEAAAVSSIDHTLFDAPAVLRWGDDMALDLAAFGQCSGCVEGAPAFVDAAHGDFHPSDASPAHDSGGPSAVAALYQALYGESLAVDIEGAPRTAGAGPDMGAFER